MEKDVEERFTALETLLKDALDSKATEVKAEADASAVDAEVAKRVGAISVSLEAVEAARAELLPTDLKSLTESAREGMDVTVAIETAKARAVEAKELFSRDGDVVVETGRLGESASSKPYVFTGFGGGK